MKQTLYLIVGDGLSTAYGTPLNVRILTEEQFQEEERNRKEINGCKYRLDWKVIKFEGEDVSAEYTEA
jgi:hypothetical protein